MDEKKLNKIYFLVIMIALVLVIIFEILRLTSLSLFILIILLGFRTYVKYNAYPKEKRFVPLAFAGYGLSLLPLIVILIQFFIETPNYLVYFFVLYMVDVVLGSMILGFLKVPKYKREYYIKEIEMMEQKHREFKLGETSIYRQLGEVKEELKQGALPDDKFLTKYYKIVYIFERLVEPLGQLNKEFAEGKITQEELAQRSKELFDAGKEKTGG